MNLSMWIIANLLEPFEPEVHIRKESPRVLRSARLAYATNCVLVQQDGNDCLYSWNGDTIRLPDLSVREGFELLQSLFDIMFDWQGQVAEAIEKRNFYSFIELCNIVFHNPIMLTDANHACLASSNRYGPDDVDEEWRHMKTYGYSSFASTREVSEARLSYHMDGDVIRFRFRPDSGMSDNLSISLFHNNLPVGYLSVVEKDHPLNDGHMQVMVMLAHMLAPVLSQEQKPTDLNVSLLNRFLTGGSLAEESTVHFLTQRGWQAEHSYRVYTIDFRFQDGEARFRRSYQHYFAAVAAVFPCDLCGVKDNLLILLANDSLMDDPKRRERLAGLFQDTSVYMGVSLSIQGFSLLPQLLEQASFALECGEQRKADGRIYDFYHYAIDYVIRAAYSPSRCLAACHPDVWRLRQQDNVLYHTLEAYLTQDRSVTRTVQMLYIHKNTLLYRLHRIEEILNTDLSDSYTRSYMRLSFLLLERHTELQTPAKKK